MSIGDDRQTNDENMKMLSKLFGLKAATEDVQDQIYYGVYIPCDTEIGDDEEIIHVYKKRAEAVGIAKKYKKARFKSFQNHQEAVAFALQGTEPIEREGFNSSQGTDGGNANTLVGAEKPSIFKGPKPQEMVQFRKVIESGDLDLVRMQVWENPRYLVSSGDTPSILQEGSRYNALHVAVKSKRLEICDFILATVSNPAFIELLYSDDNVESCKERAQILLDLYLNTPDKAINETPLHFACKYGAKEIVDLLVSFPQCNKTQTNKFGSQPKDIICQRSEGDADLINEINAMLEERFYVPVLHSEDDSKQPIIGDPFSPCSPPNLNNDPISPRLEIRAYAGPMKRTEAQTFRKKWKTPPRTITNNIKTPLAAPKFRLQDIEKGLEKVGRSLAQELKIDWKEYWPFLDTFTDLTSLEGLNLFEEFLTQKLQNQINSSSNESFSESLQGTPKTPTENVPYGNYANEQNIKPNTAEAGLSPMSDLCMAFKAFNMSDNENRQYKSSPKQSRFAENIYNPDGIERETILNSFMNPGLNSYLCIEKSCQVYATRIHSFLSEHDCNLDQLEIEIKHLQQTIMSYMDDPRFHTVDFHLIHARVAQLTAERLLLDYKFSDDLESLKLLLKDISESRKHKDSYSSDEDDGVAANRPHTKYEKDRKKNRQINLQIKCLAKNALKYLEESRDIISPMKTVQTEEDCINAWSNLTKCNCLLQSEQFSRNVRKTASMKRNQFKSRDGLDILSSSPKSGIDFVVRKLFSQDSECDLSLSPGKNGKKISLDHIIKEDLNTSTVYDSEGEAYMTPNSQLSSDDDASDYEDADNGKLSDRHLLPIDVFINGTKPTKPDKSVYDAICNVKIDYEKYPHVYRWRHTIGLYPPNERERWPLDDCSSSPDDLDSPITCTFNLGHISDFGSGTPTRKFMKNVYTSLVSDSPKSTVVGGGIINPIALLTPPRSFVKESPSTPTGSNLRTSKWMRVTGPNTPRSTLKNKSCGSSSNGIVISNSCKMK